MLFPLLSPAHLFCSRVTTAVAGPGNLLKVLSCSHNLGGAFLKCPSNPTGKQRHAARESLKSILLILPVIIPTASTPPLLKQNPITKTHNLLLKKCFETPGMVKLLTVL